MDPIETVRRILQSAPGEGFCDPCLAFGLEVPLVTIQEISKELVRPSGDYVRNVGPCDNCGRDTGITSFKPLVADAAVARGEDRLRKCIRCSRRVNKDEEEVVNGDLFHRQCWAILRSQAQVADSRQMTRLSHLLIRDSRKRLDPGNGERRNQ